MSLQCGREFHFSASQCINTCSMQMGIGWRCSLFLPRSISTWCATLSWRLVARQQARASALPQSRSCFVFIILIVSERIALTFAQLFMYLVMFLYELNANNTQPVPVEGTVERKNIKWSSIWLLVELTLLSKVWSPLCVSLSHQCDTRILEWRFPSWNSFGAITSSYIRVHWSTNSNNIITTHEFCLFFFKHVAIFDQKLVFLEK